MYISAPPCLLLHIYVHYFTTLYITTPLLNVQFCITMYITALISTGYSAVLLCILLNYFITILPNILNYCAYYYTVNLMAVLRRLGNGRLNKDTHLMNSSVSTLSLGIAQVCQLGLQKVYDVSCEHAHSIARLGLA